MRGIKIRTSMSDIEQRILYMYPLELHCDMEKPTSKSKNTTHKKLNVDTKECRPRRTAAAIAEMRT